MQEILFTSALAAIALALAFFLVLRKLASPPVAAPAPDWVERFSVGRYRPMERLLEEREERFLRSQPGFDEAMARRFRARRRQLFRGYLKCLRMDFGRIYSALESQLVHSSEDRPELATVLLKQRAAFTLGLLRIEGRLALHACGLGGVDVQGLLAVLESMRLELRPMATAGAVA